MEDPSQPASDFEKFRSKIGRTYQHWLDRSTVWVKARWVAFTLLLLAYLLRVYMLNGWYIITYGLGISLLNNFIGFLSPQIDPDSEGPVLPTSDADEFRPFSRRVPEFQFWLVSTKGVLVCFVMTFFELFDIPVFWPILLLYFLVLFFMTMKRQIRHMIKHRYVPWNWGKAKYAGGKAGPPPKSNK